jgi:hypothetical protein
MSSRSFDMLIVDDPYTEPAPADQVAVLLKRWHQSREKAIAMNHQKTFSINTYNGKAADGVSPGGPRASATVDGKQTRPIDLTEEQASQLQQLLDAVLAGQPK